MRNSLILPASVFGCVAIVTAGITIRASDMFPQASGEASADVVTIEFRAVTSAGTPVVDLRPDEVTMKVDGRARDIRSFALIQLPPPADPTVVEAPEPFVTNATPEGRNVLVVVDDESMPAGGESPVRRAIGELVTNLSSADRVGFRTPRGGMGLWLTSHHARALAAVNATVGRAQREETDTEAVCRTKVNLDALSAAIGDLSRQTHPMLVYLSQKLTLPPREGGSARMSTPAGLCELRWQDIEEIGTAASNAGVALHVAQLVDDRVSGTAENIDQQAGLETLAGVSGQPLVRLTGNTAGAFAALARESSAYYVVAFEPDPKDRGTTRRLEVAVGRPGVKTTAASRVVIPKPGRQGSKTPTDLMQLSAVHRGIALRASAFTSRGTESGKVNVLALFEPAQRSAKLASAVVALFDTTGQPVAKVTLSGGRLSAFPVACSLATRPGNYLLRVAAIDTDGRSGTVDYELHAELTKADPVTLSALVLGAVDKGSLAPRLEFSSENSAVGHFEIYGAPAGTISAVLELADAPDGPALATVNAQISDPANGARRVYGSIPLSRLASGQALVRAVVSVDGKPVGRLFATLAKVAG